MPCVFLTSTRRVLQFQQTRPRIEPHSCERTSGSNQSCRNCRMNCQNCGAPLDIVAGAGHPACCYCESGSVPASLAISVDRLVPLEQPAVISCPHCEQLLALGSLDRRRVLHCESCRGILVPMGDFADLVRRRRRSYRGPEHPPRPIAPEQLQQHIACPACSRTMEVHPYYGPGCVVIDSCRACRLIWLDSGEITRIERSPGRR